MKEMLYGVAALTQNSSSYEPMSHIFEGARAPYQTSPKFARIDAILVLQFKAIIASTIIGHEHQECAHIDAISDF